MLSAHEVREELQLKATYCPPARSENPDWAIFEYGHTRVAANLKKSRSAAIMAPADLAIYLLDNGVPGVSIDHTPVHYSGLTGFPKRLNRGRDPEAYGYWVNFDNRGAVDRLLDVMAGDELDTAKEEASSDLSHVPPNDRRRLVLARRGQGAFRSDLDDIWDEKCAVTENPVRELLRASHIKAYSRCENWADEVDSDNGLLLVATLDAAFDKGLISFEDDGRLMISGRLEPTPEKWLGVSRAAKLRIPPNSKQRVFLDHHRSNCFKRV